MKNVKSFYSFVNEGIRDKMTPKSKEDIKNKLNKLSLANRIEKIFDTDDILDIYTGDEIKKLLNRAITTDDKLEKIASKKEILDLYTKDEIKGMLNELEPSERYGRISDYDLTDFFTEDEINEYMEDADRRDIYMHFRLLVRRGELEKVKNMLDKWQLNIRSNDPQLVEASVESDSVEMVKFLVDKGMDLHSITFDRVYSWMLQEKNSEIIEFFLKKDSHLQWNVNEKEKRVERELNIIRKFTK